MGDDVISESWDFLQETTETRRDGDIEPVLLEALAVLVPNSGPSLGVLGSHETLVVGERLRVRFGEDDHAVSAQNAGALAEEEGIVPDLDKTSSAMGARTFKGATRKLSVEVSQAAKLCGEGFWFGFR